MKSTVDLVEASCCDVKVDLSCLKRFVSQELHQRVDIRSPIEKVSCETMPEQVWIDRFHKPSRLGNLPNHIAHRARCHSNAAECEEKSRFIETLVRFQSL